MINISAGTAAISQRIKCAKFQPMSFVNQPYGQKSN